MELMMELNELRKQHERWNEKQLFVKNTALSFFCFFTPLGKYRKMKLLKLIKSEIEEIEQEIEILNRERFSILMYKHDSREYVLRQMNDFRL